MLNASLKVVGGKHDTETIPLSSPKFLIGRESDCHLRPNSDMVSRHHCAFTIDDFAVRLRDLGSTNGTLVNGERIRGVVQLNAGDEITVGKLQFEFVLGDVPASATPESMHKETAELSIDDTNYDVPAVPPEAPAEAQSDTTIHTAEQIQQQTAAAAVPPPQPETVPQQPPVPPGYQYAQYPQQQAYYPPAMGYPPQPGYYPQFPYPQPVVMGQPIPQPPYPAQPPAAPAPGAAPESLPDVRLPDPSSTGAAESEQSANPPDGEPPTAEKNPSEHAADIIRNHVQRLPDVGS
ncbi:MAG: FHA domain-containing protein [Planctomycetaceae bacterium]